MSRIPIEIINNIIIRDNFKLQFTSHENTIKYDRDSR